MRPDKIRGNVFVANLPRGLKDEELAEAFDPFGIVLNAHMARDPATGETLGHGLGSAAARARPAGPTRTWAAARRRARVRRRPARRGPRPWWWSAARRRARRHW